MTKIDTLKASFNAGELSPRLHARTDFVKYPAGLEECRNLIPLPEGGVTRRPGTRFVAETADSTKKGRLFGFEATAEQHHVLELGENIIRFFFRQGQQVALDTDAVITNGLFPSGITDWDDRSTGGAGNQISHDATNDRLTLETGGIAADDIGWAEQDVVTTDLNQETVIKFEVIGDPGDKIEFQVGSSSTGSETLSPVEMQVGFHCVAFTPTTSPFYIQFRNLGINADKDVQIDNISIIDDSALEIGSPYVEGQLFQIMGAQSNDVKYLFRSGVAPYKLERRALASWSLIRVAWEDGPYIKQNTTATTLTPAATSGVAVAVTASSIIGINGGVGFLSTDVGRLVRIDNGSEWGWGIIVGITSTKIVNIHVKKAFSTTSATIDWRLGAWSDTTGWPKTGGFFEQRLYVASTDFQSQTLWGSQTGDFENFKPDDNTGTVEDDDALNFTLSADSVQEIRWLSAGQDTLAIGTAGGEWVPSAAGIVITPLDITIRRQTTHGSALVAPLRVDHVVLFVQRANRKIREFVFNFEIDSFLAPDITRLAQHITAPGIGEMAFQQEPDSLVWVARSDGGLLSLTFRRDEDVVGWAQHNIGGKGTEPAEVSFIITGGTESFGVNQITSVTVDGNELLNVAIDFTTDEATTASLFVTGNLPAIVISGAAYDIKSYAPTPQAFTTQHDGLLIDPTGKKVFTIENKDGESFWELQQHDLGTALDITTASKVTTLDLSGQLNAVSSLSADKDGTRFYICDSNSVHQWNLSTPWTLAGASYAGKYNAFATDGLTPTDCFWSNDGLRAILVKASSAFFLYQYSATSAFEVFSLSYDNIFKGVGSFVSGAEGPLFSRDGTQFFHVDKAGNDSFLQYSLSAWDITTLSDASDDTLDVSPEDTGPRDIAISADHSKLFMLGDQNSSIYQYSFPVPIIVYTFSSNGPTVTITGTDNTFDGQPVVITTSGDVEITSGGVDVDDNTFTMTATGIVFSESVVTIAGNDGVGQVQNSEDRDEVWTMVKRTINSETKRYVEFFEGYYDNLIHDQEDAYYSDSIITYDGVLTDTITGLSHLEGETVKVWGDGSILPDVVVSNGQITLATAVKVAQIGLAYKHRLKTLKIEGGNPEGTAMGKKKRINSITFVLHNSHTLSFGPNDDNLFETDFRLVSDPMDAGAPLFTGEQFRSFDGGLTSDARIIVESDDPAPFTLLAMIPEAKVNPSK